MQNTSGNLCSCVKCKKMTTHMGIHSHYRIAHTIEGQLKATAIGKLGGSSLHPKTLSTKQENRSKYDVNPKNCKHCSTNLPWDKRNNSFCSSSCGAIHNNELRRKSGWLESENSRASKSLILKSKILSGEIDHSSKRRNYTRICQCKICEKWFPSRKNGACSTECLRELRSQVGKRSATSRVKRSKHEIALFNLCASAFNEVTHNEPMFNGWDADILIKDHKIAILWNGPWHYKEMPKLKHSLLQVQNRDKIKATEIAKAGWELLIFEDRYFSPETAFAKVVEVVGI